MSEFLTGHASGQRREQDSWFTIQRAVKNTLTTWLAHLLVHCKLNIYPVKYMKSFCPLLLIKEMLIKTLRFHYSGHGSIPGQVQPPNCLFVIFFN